MYKVRPKLNDYEYNTHYMSSWYEHAAMPDESAGSRSALH